MELDDFRKSTRKSQTHNGEAEDESPETCHGVILDGLPESHIVLAFLSLKGIIHDVLLGQDLGVAKILLLHGMVDIVDVSHFVLGVSARRHDGLACGR
jgi:hypothetical protein